MCKKKEIKKLQHRRERGAGCVYSVRLILFDDRRWKVDRKKDKKYKNENKIAGIIKRK